MAINFQECEAQALRLPARERAMLAEHLIKSLDELDDAEIERLWVEEADRRYQAFKRGEISARSAEDVMREAR